jgi:hypothetical protein
MSHVYHWRGSNKQDRIDRARHHFGDRRSYRVVALNSPDAFDPEKEDAARHGIGGNNAPRYDPDQPVTGFPSVVRDIAPFDAGDGTEISSRSKLRAFEKERGVKQVGLEWSGDSDVPRCPVWDDYKDHRKERERQLAKGKADPGNWKQRKARDDKAKAKIKGK